MNEPTKKMKKNSLQVVADDELFRRQRWMAIGGLSGVLSPLFIIAATTVGAFLRQQQQQNQTDGYDHVRDSISRLYETDAPNAEWLMLLFTTYHALVIPLAYGLHVGLPASGVSFTNWLGPLLLAMAGMLGIPLGCYARCDVGCWKATTFRGKLHGILVLTTVPLVLSAMLLVWKRTKGDLHWKAYARHTFRTAIASTVCGIVMMPYLESDYEGLFERISVSIILQWYAVSGILLMKKSSWFQQQSDKTEKEHA